MLIDTHCHPQFFAYKDDREEVIKRTQDKGVIMLVVGTQKDTSKWGVELAEKHDGMFATIATHPIHLHSTHVDEEESHFMSREEDFDWEYYAELAKSPKVVGVGECGLDLYHIPDGVPVSEVLQKQMRVYKDHILFAAQHELPLSIHCREAHDENIALLKQMKQDEQISIRAVIHCFTSHWEHAQQYLDMGLYLGLNGTITFPPKKSAPELQEQLLEVVKKAPLDRIVLETDSPYLTPNIRRGQRNEPWLVEEVVKKIAEVRGISYEEVAKATTENTLRLFDRMQV